MGVSADTRVTLLPSSAVFSPHTTVILKTLKMLDCQTFLRKVKIPMRKTESSLCYEAKQQCTSESENLLKLENLGQEFFTDNSNSENVGLLDISEESESIPPRKTESSLSHELEQQYTSESKLLHQLENLGQILQQKHGDLMLVSNFVKDHKKARLPLGESDTLYLRLCDLNGTEYMGWTYMLESWEELYLPKPAKMEVLGTLESKRGMLPCPQWIVLVGEDRHVYAYKDETIHLIADSLQALVKSGINHNGATYYFPDVLPEAEEILQQDPEIQAIRQRTRKLLVENDVNFDDW